MADLISANLDAIAREARRAADHRFIGALLAGAASMTDEDRAAAREAAAREQQQRERAEQQRVREAYDRHTHVLDRQTHPALRAVAELHVPSDDSVDECAGCPAQGGYDWDVPADWPCDTFLLVESAES